MARFYVVALRNDKLRDIAKELSVLPSFYENADSKELLGDISTHIDEAVAIEWNDKSIFSILARERNDAIRDLCEKIKYEEDERYRSACLMRCDYIAHFGKVPPKEPTPPTENSLFESLANTYIKKFDRLKGTFVVPLLSDYVETPIGWRDAKATLDTKPQAAIVYITQDEFLTLPVYVQAHIARALRCTKYRKSNTILKRLVETVEMLRDMTNAEPAAGITPTTAPDAADATAEETPATGTSETAEAAPVERSEYEAALADAGFTEVKGAYLSSDRNDEPVEMKPATKKQLIKILPYISEVKRKEATSDRWGRPDEYSSKIQSGRCENIVLEREGVQYMVIYAKCEIDRKEKRRFGVRIHELTKSGKVKPNTYQFFKG